MNQATTLKPTSPSTSLANRSASGVWSPVLVPLDKALNIDARRFVQHAAWCLEQGCHGLALFGTTSEANSFSVDERMSLLEAALEGGIDPSRVMVGTGCCAITDSVRLTRHALAHGCTRTLVLPPFYYKGVSDQGLFRSYAALIDQVASDDLRVYLYHIPGVSGVPITQGLIDLLLARYAGTVAGIKDSSGDWANTAALLKGFPSLDVFPGSEVFLLDGLRAGGCGCITATANVNPAGVRAVFDRWSTSAEDADEVQNQATQIRKTIQSLPTVPTLKYLNAHYRKDPEWTRVRPPMLELPAEDGDKLVATLEEQGFQFTGV